MTFPLYVLRVKRWGTSIAVILPLSMRQQLNIGLGDILAVRLQPPYGVFCVWPATAAVKLNEINARAFPPLTPEALKHA